jgi:hypothetical protein
MLAFAFGTVGKLALLGRLALAELRKRDLLAGSPGASLWARACPASGASPGTPTSRPRWRWPSPTPRPCWSGGLVGPAQAAFWRVGRQVADAIAKPAKLLTPALYPELARLRAEQRYGEMWRLARQVGLLAGGVGAVLLAISAFAGPPLLATVMGRASPRPAW